MNKVRPKKQLGQHFLTDERVASKVADVCLATGEGKLLEIGPGMGVLTKYLLESGRDLACVEIDDESVGYLQEHYPDLEIHALDFLKFDLKKLTNDQITVVGNFPYNISSQIMFRILEYRDMIDGFAGMFQLEVAQRIAAGPGTKIYGILSVLVSAFYDVRIDFKIPPGVFNPPPKVMSAVISGTRKQDHKLNCDESLFFNIVKTSFNHRRKTLANNLKKFNIDRDLLLQNQFAKLRAEKLSVEDFVELTRFVDAHRKQ